MMRIHAFLPRSRANGPGARAVLWLQGCTLGCPGCFNPGTHLPEGGIPVDEMRLARRIADMHNRPDGITVSGGEPLFQEEALERFLAAVRNVSSLSVLLFSGYEINEIGQMRHGPAILSMTDILVAGRYDRNRHVGVGLLGSSNQRIHFLTSRYGPSDLAGTVDLEAQIGTDGSVVLTGIGRTPPPDTAIPGSVPSHG